MLLKRVCTGEDNGQILIGKTIFKSEFTVILPFFENQKKEKKRKKNGKKKTS